jgi:hypothetical protein
VHRLSAYRDGLEYNHLPWPELKDLQDVQGTEDKVPPKNEKHKVKSNDTLQKKKKTRDSMPEVEKVSVKRNEDDLAKNQRSNVRAEKGICLIEGCNVIANVRGLCHSHYQAFRKGTIDHPVDGTYVPKQIHHKSKIKTDKIKPESQPKATQPGKESPIKSTSRSYPFPDIVSLNFTDYPELKAIVFETASKFLMPINHIIMTLIGEAIATRVKKYKANK